MKAEQEADAKFRAEESKKLAEAAQKLANEKKSLEKQAKDNQALIQAEHETFERQQNEQKAKFLSE